MDTSEEYIKMCEKAEEIQKNWKKDIGDVYIACEWANTKQHICYHYREAEGKHIWFPRQDQLQEMMNFNYEKMGAMHYVVLLGCQKNAYYCQFNSMEQLWLAFVMKEKYNKTWNGKDWEKIK